MRPSSAFRRAKQALEDQWGDKGGVHNRSNVIDLFGSLPSAGSLPLRHTLEQLARAVETTWQKGSGDFMRMIYTLQRRGYIETRDDLVSAVCNTVGRWHELGREEGHLDTGGYFFTDVEATMGLPLLPALFGIRSYSPPPWLPGVSGHCNEENPYWLLPRLYGPELRKLCGQAVGEEPDFTQPLTNNSPEWTLLKAIAPIFANDVPLHYPPHRDLGCPERYYGAATHRLLYQILPETIAAGQIRSTEDLVRVTRAVSREWQRRFTTLPAKESRSMHWVGGYIKDHLTAGSGESPTQSKAI